MPGGHRRMANGRGQMTEANAGWTRWAWGLILQPMNCPGLLLASLGMITGLSALAAPAKPNILLILSDDMGFSDVGCYSSDAAHAWRFVDGRMRLRCSYCGENGTSDRRMLVAGQRGRMTNFQRPMTI